MKYTENAINVLTAITYKGIGKAWIVKNIHSNMNEEGIISLLNNHLKVNTITHCDFDKKKVQIKYLVGQLEGVMDGIVAIGDNNFPIHRGNVKNSQKPIFLFYRGDLSLLDRTNTNIAVIGLLKPDKNTVEIEQQVVAKLVDYGVIIISGLALGCDTVAHRQALDSQGKTVAILPGPLNNILPAANKVLAQEIIDNGGLLITEYLTDFKSKRELISRYQERDRLQALFSDTIILSASYAKNNKGNDSGSRLAMEYALDYSIPRAIIYDSAIDSENPKYDLSRQLIAEEKNIYTIDKGNMLSIIKEIIYNKPDVIKNTQPTQTNLF